MKKIKIKKLRGNEYNFEIKKRYVFKKNYIIKQKTFQEQIRDFLSSFKKNFSSKKQVSSQKGPSFNPFLILFLFGIGFLLLFSFLIITKIPTSYEQSSYNYVPSTVYFLGGEVISSSSNKPNIAYSYLTIKNGSENISNITLYTYSYPVNNLVFVIESQRIQSNNFPEFYKDLKSILSKQNIVVSKISLNNLDSVPEGSILVLPSGALPYQFLQDNASLYKSLINKHISLIYIGSEWDGAIDSKGGFVALTPSQKNLFNFNFVPFYGQTSDLLYLKSPLYSLAKSYYNESLLYGMISFKSVNHAYIIFVPQKLDTGWNNAYYAAKDIAFLITNIDWIDPISKKQLELKNYNSDFIFSKPFDSDKIYLRIVIKENNSSNIIIASKALSKHLLGDIYIYGGYAQLASKITYSRISGKIVTHSNQPMQNIYYRLLLNGNETILSDKIGFVDPKVTISFSIEDLLNPGNYVLDIYGENNKTFAKALLIQDPIYISLKVNPLTSNFSLKFLDRFDNPNKISSATIEVYSNKSNKLLYKEEINDVSSYSFILNQGMGTLRLKSDVYIIKIKINDYEQTLVYEAPKEKNPIEGFELYYGVMGSLLIIFIAIYFYFNKTPERIYYLDIPDFPPILTTKIKMKVSEVLNIFDELNKFYKWKFIPLNLEELKFGFGKKTYKGKSIIISDYNLKYILDILIKKGLVKKVLDLYSLVAWESQSGRSSKYLAIYRKIRDLCISYIIPFTKLNSSKEYDVKLTIVAQDIYVHIYDNNPKDIIKKAIKSINKGINLIVFSSEEDKSEFLNYLRSNSRLVKIFKLEMDAENILLLTLEELKAFIKDMKVL